MSSRGRGRRGGGATGDGRGRGRGQQRGDQPAPSYPRGGGTSGGRGRGRGAFQASPAPPGPPQSYEAPAAAQPSETSAAALARTSGGRGRGAFQPSPAQPGPPQSYQAPAAQQPPETSAAALARTSGGRGRGAFQASPPPPGPPQSYQAPAAAQQAETSAAALARAVQTVSIQQPAETSQPGQTSAPIQTTLPPSSSKALSRPVRPGYGTLGSKCLVKANHFLVEVADKDLYHYDVSISPDMSSKQVCRDILQQLVQLFRESHLGNRWLAYDGRKSVYTAGPLPFSSKEFVVKLSDKDNESRREREFKVVIKFASKPDIHHLQQFLMSRQLDVPQETIQVLDVVLRATPTMNYEVVGRSFFSTRLGQKGELADGLEYWMGFYQSLRPTQMGLTLNIDMSARAFYEPIVVSEYVSKYLNGRDLSRPLSDQDRVKIKKALKGVRIELNHGGRVKRCRISGLSTQPSNQLMFSIDDTGEEMSVAQYFHRRYNITLRYASLPALQAGSDQKPIHLPMEVCKIVPGQRYSKKLNDNQVRALLRATCQRPHERENSIRQMVQHNNYNNDVLAKEFGLRVRAELTSIEARVLAPPMLQYHNTGKEAQVNPQVGQWNMINKKMVNGGTVDSWTCISFSSRVRPDMVDHFCQELVKMCSSKGMSFNPRPLVPIGYFRSNQIEKALEDTHRKCGGRLQLLIIILPDVRGSYGKIKRICETELGIVSQCCQPQQAQRLSMQYLENVSLKINVKVGGRNNVLVDAIEKRIPYLTDRPTIIFGADVTHPQPGEDSSPSIAAVVASMDWPEATKFRGLVSAQAHREEIIQDLYNTTQDSKKGLIHGGMIRELLIAFRRSTGQKPHRIIFYRDGVSEGQFNQVLLYEMDAIRKACRSLEENYLPPVTFVVVQKRHHTRLFAANHRDRNSMDRSGNILPGTVVDRSICHPTEFDFFLCSHAGIQGTSRPTHYHVLYDENKFNADALQMLTYNLCYTYARCARSVSIVPPAYYAHLAAFRARYYIEGEVSESGSTGASSSRATRDRLVEVRQLPNVKDNVKEVMFYC